MSECMQVEPEHDKRQNIRTFVNGWYVFLNLKTGSVKFQRLSNADKIVSGLSEVARGFMFHDHDTLPGLRKFT